jgi:uncharacterized protein (UPF0297 family)
MVYNHNSIVCINQERSEILAEVNNTQYFNRVSGDEGISVKEVLKDVYTALCEKGYNPVSQIVGYIMSGDPTYITNHNGARSLIMKVERDELLEELMQNYIDTTLAKEKKK